MTAAPQISKKRKWILSGLLILLIGLGVGLGQYSNLTAEAEKERALEWLRKQPSYDSTATHETAAARSKSSSTQILVNKFSNRGFLVQLAADPVIRIGLDKSVTFEQADKIAAALGGGVKLEETALSELRSCPEQTRASTSLPGWKLSSPNMAGIALYCMPEGACKALTKGSFELILSLREPSNSRHLGEIFDLIWRTGTCRPQGAQLSKIENVFLTSE